MGRHGRRGEIEKHRTKKTPPEVVAKGGTEGEKMRLLGPEKRNIGVFPFNWIKGNTQRDAIACKLRVKRGG